MHKQTGNKILDEKYRKSLIYSVIDGSLFALMMGVGEYYLSAYAIILGATTFQMGFFGSIPHFLGSTIQLFSPRFTLWIKSRKKAVIIASFVRTVIWIPIILTYVLGDMKVWILIISTSLYFIMNYINQSPWTSWMGDLIDDKKRTQYFATRSKTTTIVSLISIVFAGLILEYVKNYTTINPVYAFSGLFIIAFISSFLSTYTLGKKEDVPFEVKDDQHFSLIQFTKRMPKTDFGKFTIFNIIFYFGLFIAAPFFIVYQMGNLNFTYLDLMISLATTFLGKILFFKVWAKLTDEFGTAKVLAIAVFLICLLPFGWIFFVKEASQVFILNFIGGIAWSGMDLLGFNYIYDKVKPENRSLCTSYLTFYKGISILAGGFIGAFIIKQIPGVDVPFLIIFATSGFIRMIALIFFIKVLKDLKTLDPLAFRKIIFSLVSSIPREGSNTVLIGIRTAKERMKLFEEEMPISFLEEPEDDEDD